MLANLWASVQPSGHKNWLQSWHHSESSRGIIQFPSVSFVCQLHKSQRIIVTELRKFLPVFVVFRLWVAGQGCCLVALEFEARSQKSASHWTPSWTPWTFWTSPVDPPPTQSTEWPATWSATGSTTTQTSTPHQWSHRLRPTTQTQHSLGLLRWISRPEFFATLNLCYFLIVVDVRSWQTQLLCDRAIKYFEKQLKF